MAEYLSDRDICRINGDRVREEIERRRELIDNKKKELDELLQQEDTKVEKMIDHAVFTSTHIVRSKKGHVEFTGKNQEEFITIDKLHDSSIIDFDDRIEKEMEWMDLKMKAYGIAEERGDEHSQNRELGQYRGGIVKDKKISLDEERRLEEKIRRLEMEEKKMDDELAKRNELNPKYNVHKPLDLSLTEETYEEWKAEVDFIIRSGLYNDYLMRQAVRNSLTGRTRKVLLSLSPEASTRQIVEKLYSIYGDVKSGEAW